MTRKRSPKLVFLSHATRDRKLGDRIATALRKARIAVWYSRTQLSGAQQWQQEIGTALRKCDWFLVLLSPASVKSMWVKREVSYALTQKRYEDKIIPVLIRECNHEALSWTLATLQMVRFTGGFTAGCRDLLQVWGLTYRP